MTEKYGERLGGWVPNKGNRFKSSKMQTCPSGVEDPEFIVRECGLKFSL